MKRATRFGLLVGALTLASWAGFGAPAHANHHACNYLNGTPCTSPGSGHSCTFGDDYGYCRCLLSRTWSCLY